MINHYIDMNAGQFGFKFHIFLSLNLLVDKVISPLTIPPLVTGSYHQQFNRENKSVQFYFYFNNSEKVRVVKRVWEKTNSQITKDDQFNS